MIIYVDIDKTICKLKHSSQYGTAKPIQKNINKINKLYDKGHTIIYGTARGTGTNIDWYELTKKQFKEGNVKYNDIRFGKPMFDLFIDDKAVNSKEYF